MSFKTKGWFGPECYAPSIVFGFGSIQLPYMNIRKFWNPKLNPQPQNQPAGYQGNFPLEIAMKIFWEAADITISASLTSQSGDFILSSSINQTIQWGGFNDPLGAQLFGFPELNNLRSNIKTAKEMLCHINSENQLEPNPSIAIPSFKSSHTVLRAQRQLGIRVIVTPPPFSQTLEFPYGDRWTIAIQPRPYIWIPEEVNTPIEIYAPFIFEYAHWGGSLGGPAAISASPFGLGGGTSAFTVYDDAQINTPWGSVKTPMIKGPISSAGSMTITVTAANPESRYA